MRRFWGRKIAEPLWKLFHKRVLAKAFFAPSYWFACLNAHTLGWLKDDLSWHHRLSVTLSLL